MKSVAIIICSLLFLASSLTSQSFSSQLPLMIVSTQGTEIVDEPKTLVSCGIINNESGINNTDDPFNEYDGFIGIEIRGQSSTLFEKKSYGIEFRDQNNIDLNVEVLGFPIEEDFVLHGPYSDKSLIRNAIVYTLAEDIMEYAPRSKFIELIIDDEYRGVYLMVERIKKDENRVDIATLKEEDIEGEEVEGGYILRFDKTDSDAEILWTSPIVDFEGSNGDETKFVAFYPKFNDIQKEQIDYIEDYISDFENALIDPTYTYSGQHYSEFIDVSTVIDFMLINEITKNVDGYRISTYFHKDKGDVIKMGPVWDFNLAIGNADYCEGGEPHGWQFNFGFVCPWDNLGNHFWWRRFLSDPWFEQRLIDRYNELRESHFSIESLNSRIDSLVQAIGDDAINRNFEKFNILGQHIWPNYFVGESHEEEINYIKDWFFQRVDFMDNTIEDLTNIEGLVDPLNLYPNPNNGHFILDLGRFAVTTKFLHVYNSQGALIDEKRIEFIDEHRYELNLSTGIYFLRAMDTNGKTLGNVQKISIY